MLFASLFAVLPAACGGDDDNEGGGSSGSKPTSFAVKATDSGLTAPKTVKAGVVKITLTNDGKKPHSAQLVKVSGGHTVEEADKATSGNVEKTGVPSWITTGGGVGTTAPGQTRTATQVLEPGTYGVSDDEENSKAKPLTFKVTGEASGGGLPKAPATITAKDYSFTTSGLKPGKNEVLFQNTGKELHHAIAFKLNPGASLGDASKFFQSNGKGKPPFSQKGMESTPVIDSGTKEVTDLNLKSGKYALVCFISDREGGPPHVAKGMIAEVDVK